MKKKTNIKSRKKDNLYSGETFALDIFKEIIDKQDLLILKTPFGEYFAKANLPIIGTFQPSNPFNDENHIKSNLIYENPTLLMYTIIMKKALFFKELLNIQLHLHSNKFRRIYRQGVIKKISILNLSIQSCSNECFEIIRKHLKMSEDRVLRIIEMAAKYNNQDLVQKLLEENEKIQDHVKDKIIERIIIKRKKMIEQQEIDNDESKKEGQANNKLTICISQSYCKTDELNNEIEDELQHEATNKAENKIKNEEDNETENKAKEEKLTENGTKDEQFHETSSETETKIKNEEENIIKDELQSKAKNEIGNGLKIKDQPEHDPINETKNENDKKAEGKSLELPKIPKRSEITVKDMSIEIKRGCLSDFITKKKRTKSKNKRRHKKKRKCSFDGCKAKGAEKCNKCSKLFCADHINSHSCNSQTTEKI